VRSVTQVKECGRTFKPRIKHRTPVGKGRGKKTVSWGKGRGERVCVREKVRDEGTRKATGQRKRHRHTADQTGELTSHVGRWGRENAESSVPVRGLAGTPSPAKKKTLHIDATNGQEGRKEGRYGGRKGRK